MKSASPRRTMKRTGTTLLELTVVVTVLLSIAALLTIGANAWRRGTDRVTCVINISNVQTSVRSYQTLYGYSPGTMPYAENGTQSIAEHLLRKGYISEGLHKSIAVSGGCPGGGDYQIPHEEVFPANGKLYLSCSLEKLQNHQLPEGREW